MQQLHRKLLMEGDVTVTSSVIGGSNIGGKSGGGGAGGSGGPKKREERAVYWFLFTDVLVETRRKEKPGRDKEAPPACKYKYLRHLALDGIIVKDAAGMRSQTRAFCFSCLCQCGNVCSHA